MRAPLFGGVSTHECGGAPVTFSVRLPGHTFPGHMFPVDLAHTTSQRARSRAQQPSQQELPRPRRRKRQSPSRRTERARHGPARCAPTPEKTAAGAVVGGGLDFASKVRIFLSFISARFWACQRNICEKFLRSRKQRCSGKRTVRGAKRRQNDGTGRGLADSRFFSSVDGARWLRAWRLRWRPSVIGHRSAVSCHGATELGVGEAVGTDC